MSGGDYELMTAAEVEFVYDWTPDDPNTRTRFAAALAPLIAAAEQRGRETALREAADFCDKRAEASLNRTFDGRWMGFMSASELRERADRERA